jgi:hypothetical protein
MMIRGIFYVKKVEISLMSYLQICKICLVCELILASKIMGMILEENSSSFIDIPWPTF